MKLPTLGMLLAIASTVHAQSLDRVLPALERTTSDDELTGSVSGGLSLFDITDGDFKDANGVAIIGSVGVFGTGPDAGLLEVGYFGFSSEMENTPTEFMMNIITIGGGYRFMMRNTKLSMGMTGGFLYYFSSDIDDKDELNDGLYGSLFATVRVSEPAGIFARLTTMYVGHAGRIDGEGMDWITAMTFGAEVQF